MGWSIFSADVILRFFWFFFLFIMSPNLWGGGSIDFGEDAVGVGIGIGVSVTLSCLHNILWTNGWSLIKFSKTYNWYITKNWLDFGDLDLIFKVTAAEKLKKSGRGGGGVGGGAAFVFSENTVTILFYFFLFYLFFFSQRKIRFDMSCESFV